MKVDFQHLHKPHDRVRGFTLVELVTVLAIMLVITSVSLPAFLQAIRSYQLNDAATKVSSLLKFTRFEAIRRNTPISLQLRQSGTSLVVTNLWTDSNDDATEEDDEDQLLFSGSLNLVPPSAPSGTSTLASAVGVGALTPVSFSSTAGSVTFDQRGAVTPAQVYVLYLGNLAFPNLGNRAVILLPSGTIQIWTGTANGTWQQLSQ